MSQQSGNIFSSLNKSQEGQKQEPGNIFTKSTTGSNLGLNAATDSSKQQGSAPGSLFGSVTTTDKKPEGSLFGTSKPISGPSLSTGNKDSLFNKPTTIQNNAANTEVKSSLDLNIGSKPSIFNKGPSTDASNAQKKENAPGDIFNKTTATITQEKPKESGNVFSKTEEPKQEPGNIFSKKESAPGDIFSKTTAGVTQDKAKESGNIFSKIETPKQDSQTKPAAQPNILGQNKLSETSSGQPQTQQSSIFGGAKTSSIPSNQTEQPKLSQSLIQTKPSTEGAFGKSLTQGQSRSTLFPKPTEADSKPKETSILGSQIGTNTALQNKGLLGDQTNKTGLSTFGPGGMVGAQQKLEEVKKPEGAGTEIETDSTGQDVTIEGLLKTWKEDLDRQVQIFAEVNKSLEQHEIEAYKNIDMGEKLLKNLQEMEKEYRAIELACDGIDKGQSNLLYKLNGVEQELSNYLYKDENNNSSSHGKMSRTDLINQAKNLNNEISKIENEMTKLINEMSQSVGDKEHDNLSENLLDSYFDALQFVESETLKSITKLNKIESELVSQ